MVTIILCSKNDEYIKHWSENLNEIGIRFFVKKTKSELFEYLNEQKTHSLLLLESEFIDNDSFLSLLKRSYPYVKVLVFSFRVDAKEADNLKKHNVKAYAHAFLNSELTKKMIESVENGKNWYSTDFLDTFEPEEVEDEFSRIRVDKQNLLQNNESLQDDIFSNINESQMLNFSGKYDEYEIIISKKMQNILIINDKMSQRDGCTLVDFNIKALKFTDIKVFVSDLYSKRKLKE